MEEAEFEIRDESNLKHIFVHRTVKIPVRATKSILYQATSPLKKDSFRLTR